MHRTLSRKYLRTAQGLAHGQGNNWSQPTLLGSEYHEPVYSCRTVGYSDHFY